MNPERTEFAHADTTCNELDKGSRTRSAADRKMMRAKAAQLIEDGNCLTLENDRVCGWM